MKCQSQDCFGRKDVPLLQHCTFPEFPGAKRKMQHLSSDAATYCQVLKFYSLAQPEELQTKRVYLFKQAQNLTFTSKKRFDT